MAGMPKRRARREAAEAADKAGGVVPVPVVAPVVVHVPVVQHRDLAPPEPVEGLTAQHEIAMAALLDGQSAAEAAHRAGYSPRQVCNLIAGSSVPAFRVELQRRRLALSDLGREVLRATVPEAGDLLRGVIAGKITGESGDLRARVAAALGVLDRAQRYGAIQSGPAQTSIGVPTGPAPGIERITVERTTPQQGIGVLPQNWDFTG